MDSASFTSPAKINLFLDIRGKRPDGYHETLTWMQTIDLCDTLTLARSARDFSTLRSDNSSMPLGKRNLCIKAYEAARAAAGDAVDSVEISLKKRVPLGSGLGGGSSNAASVIKGLNVLFSLGMTDEKMSKIAAGVGTDVPFFIRGGAAIASGRGEIISPLPSLPAPIHLLVAKPEASVSTGEAYKWVKGYKGERDLDREETAARIASGDLQYVMDRMFNCFEEIVFGRLPALAALKSKLLDAGCVKAQMTGSGSAVFGICPDEKTARSAASALSADDDTLFVAACRTI
ncbi:MAG: 4-diphosphocytidyl-2-C-methyl-D-erythritol kinase [bacterium ADurb.Bin236]|nr:MAG: 4-diphosphocytidyl-2-C-methyl-D-erythritol kinase [bacterium ADurb.Bin236]HOY63124.1 4-(cytidine 5'-diphospho)-2-C-methyl-D-erythritol kinase [bacterium]HPN93734.1 4-(cytidine 5'-diphospho)-2-C-methyl-D-erythritol kinase [bacterium]